MSGPVDDPIIPDPVRPISRVAAPGGVPLGLTILGAMIWSPLVLFITPYLIPVAFIAWWWAQKWINGDLKKPVVAVKYAGGAMLSPDPILVRADGTRRPLWGGSTFAPLTPRRGTSTPRFIALPED